MYRAKNAEYSDSESYCGDLDEDIFIAHTEGSRSPMSSTMISSVSTASMYDPAGLNKLTVLEDELASLRNQIASLVLNQEQINQSIGKYLGIFWHVSF